MSDMSVVLKNMSSEKLFFAFSTSFNFWLKAGHDFSGNKN